MSIFDFFKKKTKEEMKNEPSATASVISFPKFIAKPKTKEEIKNNFHVLGIENLWEKMHHLTRNSIRLSLFPAGDNEIIIGSSKIGGCPDFPQDIKWPCKNGEPLSFIAQINFAEVKQYDLDNELPERGFLYLFYDAVEQDAWGYDFKDNESFSVQFYDVTEGELVRAAFPENLAEIGKIASATMSFTPESNVPDYFSCYFENITWRNEVEEYEWDVFTENFSSEESTHKLLGHSNNIQDSMEDECQLVTNELFCGDSSGYNDPRAAELRKGAINWKLLFQIDSDEDLGLMWGDGGRLYVWIKQDDLAKKDFSKTWLILQCY